MKCCICCKDINGHGHNPWPLNKDNNTKCCDKCNVKVLEARMKEAKGESK